MVDSTRTEEPAQRLTARVRGVDWSATELGARDTWPTSLDALVEVVLAHPWPALLWWGPRKLQVYNDAASRDLLGDCQRPGAPAAEGWGAPWAQLDEAAEQVRTGHGPRVLDCIRVAAGPVWSLALSPVPDGRGGVGGVLVTARREPELDRLRAQFAQAPAPIAILHGPDYLIELANPAMITAWGRSPEATIGRPLFEAVPEAAARFGPVLDLVRASGEPVVGKEVPYRTSVVDSSRVERRANFLISPLRDLEGRVEGVLVIAVDVTDELLARDEMQRLRVLAEAANRSKDEFLAMLGHELRNPLAPIATTLQVMRMRGGDSRVLDVLERQVGHLTRLVDDLLDVARVARGKIDLHRRDVELAELVAEALEVASPLLEQRRHVIDLDVPRHGLGVHADSGRLIQAISNLVTNAAKYSELGSPITIRGTRANGTVRLSVRDRGAGIEPAMIGQVFDRFVQQPQTLERARGGLGLGLAIARSIVELHGGTMAASSEGVGKGSEFTLELPGLPHPLTPVPDAPSGGGLARAPQRGRILVVDDNEDGAEVLGYALEQLGYEVAVAHDGPSALRTAAGFVPDVALLDLGLPAMDGYELAARLRDQRPAGAVPSHLVAVTGYGQDSDRERTHRAGFEGHLVKPVDLGVLSGLIAKLIG